MTIINSGEKKGGEGESMKDITSNHESIIDINNF